MLRFLCAQNASLRLLCAQDASALHEVHAVLLCFQECMYCMLLPLLRSQRGREMFCRAEFSTMVDHARHVQELKWTGNFQ